MKYVIPIPQLRERNHALVCGGGNQSEIPLPQLRDRNDIEPAGKGHLIRQGRMAQGLKNSWNYDWVA
jgi:hypothetical protein